MTPPLKTLSAASMAVRTAIVLFIFVVVFTGLLAAAYQATEPAIEAAAAAEKMKLIGEVLPRELYDEGIKRYGFHGLSYQFIAAENAMHRS